jgi:ribosomal protein S20
MNATNTNVVPVDNRGLGLYMDMSAKKVQKWVTHFEGKRSKSVVKTFVKPVVDPLKKSDVLKRQETFIAPGQVDKFQSRGTMLLKKSPMNSVSTFSRARTLKKLKSSVSNIDDELYDEEEHYYDEIDVLVEHID